MRDMSGRKRRQKRKGKKGEMKRCEEEGRNGRVGAREEGNGKEREKRGEIWEEEEDRSEGRRE